MRKDIGAMAVAGAFFLALAILTGSCSAFNVDLDSRIVHRSDQPESMFGFTVALHSDKAGVKRLLVGAPSYDTFSYQAGVRRGGAVLKCSAQDARPCEYVPFDRNGSRHFVFGQNISNSIYGFDDSGSSEGNNVHPIGEMLDDKSFQWFGATLRSRGGVVVACAPRYKWFTESLKRREPVGTCYVARNDLTDFQEYSPCRTREWGYHRQGSCQAGFDAALSPSGDRLFIGAPGAYYWQGQIHSQSLHSRNVYERTGEGPAILDDQLLGYSVGAGDFTGDGIADVALGVPKGLNYTGKLQENVAAEANAISHHPKKRKHNKGGRRRVRRRSNRISARNAWMDSFLENGFEFNASSAEGYAFIPLSSTDMNAVFPDRPTYGGWAIEIGEFDSRHPRKELAVSMPRSSSEAGLLTGKVDCANPSS